MLWKNNVSLEYFNQISVNTLNETLSIEFISIGNDFLVAKMQVDHRHRQPAGLLHGGANVVLAETLGSVASYLATEDPMQKKIVGIEINANHLRAVKEGYVYGKVTEIKVGKTLHVWQIEIKDEKEQLTCVSRITVGVF
ncbi:MAG: hotdog fold thioesterase [Saprospiraceae bacterium]|nr:hotdog fold thioesterase [Saprospiraceae bacterium]